MWKFFFFGAAAANFNAVLNANLGVVAKGVCVCGQSCGTANSNFFCQMDGSCSLGPPSTCSPCVCGAPCNIPPLGTIGVCHTQGSCQAVTSVPPDCRPVLNHPIAGLNGLIARATVGVSTPTPANSELTSSDMSGRNCPTCPQLKCPSSLYTPATSVNGCPACPRCRSCPKYKCIAPPCPVAQRMTPHGANGCPMCPRCNPDLFGKGCPALQCTAPPCSTENQQTLKANGCNQCPTCKKCASNSDCQAGSYCNEDSLQCMKNQPGSSCYSSTECPPQTQCTSGICQAQVPHCAPLTCPVLNCHPAAAQETTTLPNGCPGCSYCIIFTH